MMKTTTIISLAALLILVISLPVYASYENNRLAHAEETMRERFIQEGTDIYVQNCAGCHGISGEGVGYMPPLDNPALAEARASQLFDTIARAMHGTAMAAWHVEEGGTLNDYEVKELVTLIQFGDWNIVAMAALESGIDLDFSPAVETGLAFLETEGGEDPHQCISCHEEPSIHANLFGTNCARCHNSVAWTPASLTKHAFLLDHGGDGDVACQTCHPANYISYDCYGCHEDHQEEEMIEFHLGEDISEVSDCSSCHPTGVEGEADRLRQEELDSNTFMNLQQTTESPVDAQP